MCARARCRASCSSSHATDRTWWRAPSTKRRRYASGLRRSTGRYEATGTRAALDYRRRVSHAPKPRTRAQREGGHPTFKQAAAAAAASRRRARAPRARSRRWSDRPERGASSAAGVWSDCTSPGTRRSPRCSFAPSKLPYCSACLCSLRRPLSPQVLLSPRMLPPWSGLLEWNRFSVRIDPTKANLRHLGAHLGALDHTKLLAGVRAAKHALTYHLDGYTGRECVPIAC